MQFTKWLAFVTTVVLLTCLCVFYANLNAYGRSSENIYAAQESLSFSSTNVSGSDDNDDQYHSVRQSRIASGRHSVSSLSQEHHYKSLAKNTLNIAWKIMESEGWKRETGQDEVKGIVYSKTVPTYGKVFKLVAELEVDSQVLFDDLIENASSMPRWNPTVLEVKTLHTIDDHADISYNLAAEGAGGLVSSRDFVILRSWEQKDGWYVTTSVSVEYSAKPPQSKYVRGEQGPTMIRLKDLPNGHSRMEWLLNTNLKGWLPQYLIDQALSGVLMTYLDNLRTHCVNLREP